MVLIFSVICWQVNSSQLKSILGGWAGVRSSAEHRAYVFCGPVRHCRLGSCRWRLGGSLRQPDVQGQSLVPGMPAQSVHISVKIGTNAC